VGDRSRTCGHHRAAGRCSLLRGVRGAQQRLVCCMEPLLEPTIPPKNTKQIIAQGEFTKEHIKGIFVQKYRSTVRGGSFEGFTQLMAALVQTTRGS